MGAWKLYLKPTPERDGYLIDSYPTWDDIPEYIWGYLRLQPWKYTLTTFPVPHYELKKGHQQTSLFGPPKANV